MNWWKIAKLQNFEDRNIWNDKIDDLKKITIQLEKLGKLVYQTGSTTRIALRDVIGTKRLSPYPKIEELLVQAETLCLDSPQRCSELCKKAAQEVVKRVKSLEAERKQFINKELPDTRKGWRSDE